MGAPALLMKRMNQRASAVVAKFARFLMVACSTPNSRLYSRSEGTSYTTYPGYVDPLANTGYGAAFNTDGSLCAVVNAGGTLATIWSVDAEGVFTKLPNLPSGQRPSGTARAVDFAGIERMVIASSSTPFVHIYSIIGTTVTKHPAPTVRPTGTGRGIRVSQDQQFVAVAHSVAPFVTTYSLSGTTLTALASNIDVTLPGIGYSVGFGDGSTYMAVAHAGGQGLSVYKRSGVGTDTQYVKLSGSTGPNVAPPGAGRGVCFSPDGVAPLHLAVATITTPFITVYKQVGDVFEKLPNLPATPPNAGQGVAYSPDGKYLGVTHSGFRNVTIYERNGDEYTLVDYPTPELGDIAYALAFSPQVI